MADIVCMAHPTPEATGGLRIATLKKEMQSIHFANYIYWKLEDAHTLSAKAEYQRRRERLEEIHNELGRL
jgi:hypothetical protein